MIHAISSAHAGTNAGLLSGLNFFDDMRIRYVRPCHADHIDDTLAYGMTRRRRVDYAAGVKYRQRELAAKFLNPVKIRRFRCGHSGHQVDVTYRRVYAPVIEIEKVDQA